MEFVDRGAGVKGRVTMTLDEILQDIYGLDAKLRELEQRYGLLSADLYALYQLGEVEQSPDLIRWIGYYELRRERQRAYTGALRERLLAMRRAHTGAPITLQPQWLTSSGGSSAA
jgi:hypothetical protein